MNNLYRKYFKRILDIIITATALLFLWPFILILWLFVRIRLGSPAIFRQQRPGYKGKIFTLYKFRSMTDERDENGQLLPDVERITPFGRKLRDLSLDELPELWNILRGDMSIVGPRPLLVEYLDRYNSVQKHRHDVLPGLTGLAQINGRNAITWEEKFRLDVRYVKKLSFFLDMDILVKTVSSVLKKEGINADANSTMDTFMGTPEPHRKSRDIAGHRAGLDGDSRSLNILFLTLLDFDSISEHGLYTDLMREFALHGHRLFIISPVEKHKNVETHLITEDNCTILKLRIGDTQKTNIIRKGISTLAIEGIFTDGIQKYFSDIKFDLVLYSTPPITLLKAVEYVKKRDNAFTYLMLKDIFPQNAVDLGLMRKEGAAGLLYRYFRYKETRLYEVSDKIGCMSKANIDYLLQHNNRIPPSKVELCPNAMDMHHDEVRSIPVTTDAYHDEEKTFPEAVDVYQAETKLNLLYGGNLGKPQGINFLMRCLYKYRKCSKIHFTIIGSGTEVGKLKEFIKSRKLQNVTFIEQLPIDEYEKKVQKCDCGLIFLDNRFTIPNFPSRLLSYMKARKPVIAATDVNTDIRDVIEEGRFGYWCESGDVSGFCKAVNAIAAEGAIKMMGENAYKYLLENYTTDKVYDIIIKSYMDSEEKA